MKSRILAIVCAMALLLSACGGTAAADQPGNGKWRVSDIAGSVAASEEIRLQDDFAAAKNSGFIVNAEVEDSSFTSAAFAVLDRKKGVRVLREVEEKSTLEDFYFRLIGGDGE